MSATEETICIPKSYRRNPANQTICKSTRFIFPLSQATLTHCFFSHLPWPLPFCTNPANFHTQRFKISMKRFIITIVAGMILLLLSPILFRKYSVPIMSGGHVVAVGTRPLFTPLQYAQADIYVGNSKIFGLGVDMLVSPVFIHAFPDAKRYLCIFDDDTSEPVFVVDLHTTITNTPASDLWPTNADVRNPLICDMTNTVKETAGTVRLPTCSELLETSDYIKSLSTSELKRESFPTGDLGLYRFYWTRDELLWELATNRNSVSLWP
jgi:hypothetical protein